jgi:hypothetical protein
MCAAYPAIAENGEERGSPLHKLLTGRLKSLRSDPGLTEVLACLATMDNRPVVSVEQLDQSQFRIRSTH